MADVIEDGIFLVRLVGSKDNSFKLVKFPNGDVDIRRVSRCDRQDLDLSFRRMSIQGSSDTASLFSEAPSLLQPRLSRTMDDLSCNGLRPQPVRTGIK